MKVELIVVLLIILQDIYTFKTFRKYEKMILSLKTENNALKNIVFNMGGVKDEENKQR